MAMVRNGGGCRLGHAPEAFVPTGRGDGGVCVGCLVELLTDPGSFVTHRSYALGELSRCLEDDHFCTTFFMYHSHTLAAPLAESLSGCKDEELAKAMVELVLSLCRLTVGEDGSLLEEFVSCFAMHLGSHVLLWTKGQCYMLHAMGLLFELHSKHDNRVPRPVQTQENFMRNLISALQLPGDELKGEVVYLLYKISCLEDGLEEVIGLCPALINLVLGTLLKTESDEVRTNCIALLSVLARNCVFELNSHHSSQNNQFQLLCSSDLGNDTQLVTIFAEAIKGSLLSSDVQVQLSALQLIVYLFPPDMDMPIEVSVLVEEGLADYVFEVLRVSGNLSTLAVSAIRTLNILSAAKGVFSQRLIFGVEAVLRVVQHSTEAAFCSVQGDALWLLADGLSDCPGIISSSKAEQILETLSKLLQQHGNAAKDALTAGECSSTSDETYTATCSAMTSLLKLPAFSSVPMVSQRLLKTVTDVVTFILHARSPQSIRHSLVLLQEAFLFQAKRGEVLSLFGPFEAQLIPFFTTSVEVLEEEESIEAVFVLLATVLCTTASKDATLSVAVKLARDKWLSHSLASTGRFKSSKYRELVLTFVAALVDMLSDGETDDNVISAFQELPTDPDSLLFLLEQSSASNSQLVHLHSAVISIIYTAFMHDDRIVDEGPLLASLEQFILLRGSVFQLYLQTDENFFLKVISLYTIVKQGETPYSVQAESILSRSIQETAPGALLSARVPLSARKWILTQPGLKSQCLHGLHELFNAAKSSQQMAPELEAICVVIRNENGAKLVNSLLHKAALNNEEQELEAITSVLRLVSDQHARQVHDMAVLPTLRRWYVLWGSKTATSTLSSVVELLVGLLDTLTPDMYHKDGSWQDIANQTVYLYLRRNYSSLDVPLLSFLCLLGFRCSELCSLSETFNGICTNEELSSHLKERVATYSLHQPSAHNQDEQIVCLALVFQLLCLRTRRFNGDTKTVEYEHLCQIAYYCPGLPRVLALSCFAERLKHLSVTEASGLSVPMLKSVLLLVQSFMLDENELVQITASDSLFSLLTSNSFKAEHRTTLDYSPWYSFLAKELIRSLSSGETAVMDNKLKVLVALLKRPKVESWLRSDFNPASLSSLISSLSPDRLHFWEVSMFHELLLLHCLEEEHIKALSEHFQAFRRACYKRNALPNKPRSGASFRARADSPRSFQTVVERVSLQVCSPGELSTVDVLGKIDEFLQRSKLKP